MYWVRRSYWVCVCDTPNRKIELKTHCRSYNDNKIRKCTQYVVIIVSLTGASDRCNKNALNDCNLTVLK